MCLGVPMRVISVDGSDIAAEIDGVRRTASTMTLDGEIRAGDYVIIHAGFAIARLDQAEAETTLAMMREIFKPEDMA